jgi:hypothetical protein
MDNGYINATKLCALGGKKLYNWLATDKVKDMINYFETMIGNSRTAKIIIKGGDNQEVTGTYMPNELIIHAASWVSVKFAFMVSDIVKEVSLRSMINRNPGDVLLDLQCVPNSMLLFNFIRKESRTNPKAGYKCCGNSINLFIDEDEFIKFIHESYNERLTI